MGEFVQNMLDQAHAIRYILREYSNKPKVRDKITHILSDLGEYYDSDHAYVYELNPMHTEASCTFEWCRSGMTEENVYQRNILANNLEELLGMLEENGEVSLEFQENKSLLAVPLMVDDEIAGFLEIENPHRHTDELLLLSVASSACLGEITDSRGESSGSLDKNLAFETEKDDRKRLQEVMEEGDAWKKLQEANDELATLLEDEKKHTAIIGSLSSVFFALFYIDLEENSFQEIISLDSSHHVYSEKGDARISLKMLVDDLVVAEYRSIMRIFMDFDTIDARLGNKQIIIQEYIALTGGWVRCSIISVEKDENGKNTKIICGFRQITAEKEALESQDNLIQALAIPYENIYAVNGDTGEAVCYRMGQAMSDRYGKRFAAGSYERNICSYIDNDVLEEDRKLFDEVCSVAGVNKLLSDTKTWYFNYRVFRNGQLQYFQCQLVKPNRERNEFVIGFKNINEEKMQELAQQRKIEEALASVEKMNAALQEEMAVASALSQEYHSLFKIDAKTSRISLYRTVSLWKNCLWSISGQMEKIIPLLMKN